MSNQSLKNKTISGVGWSAAETFLARGVSFLVGLVLARLLSPEEYGLIGIVCIFTYVLEEFVDSGFSSALIRKPEVSVDDYNTMFTTNMVVSILMFFLLFFSAPYISTFFSRSQLIPLVRVMGLIIIFQALSIVQNTILTRRIDFKTKTKASVFSALVSGLIGILMAYTGYGVWSLVGQQLSRQLLFTLCLWFYNHWVPQIAFKKESFQYMWGFGWKILLSGLLERLWNQITPAVVGKFYSPSTLGQYSRSNEYASIFSTNITTIVKRVSYPVLSQVQNDPNRMVSAYRRIIKTTMFVTTTCMIFIGAVSEPLVYCMIGPKWHEAATYLPFICIYMSLWPLHALNLNMLQIQGRSDLFLIIELIKKIIAIGPICLGIFVSVFWMLIGLVLSGVVYFYLNSYYSGKLFDYSSWKQIKDVLPSYLLAFIIAIIVYFLKYLPCSNWIILPLQFLIGVGVFFLICEIIKLPEYIELKSIGKQYISKMKIK